MHSMIFSTVEDNQEYVNIHILQGGRPMAADNKTLGRFQLAGIPPASRGGPQIEVTFNIDANGIVHVSAKELGTGREQSINIVAASGLSKEDVECLSKQAEIHQDSDKKRKGLADLRNKSEALIYITDKSLREHSNKLNKNELDEMNNAISELKDANVETPAKLEDIQSAFDNLAKLSHKLTATIYNGAMAIQKGQSK